MKETADLQEISQAKIGIPGFFRDFVIAYGHVRNDGKQERMQGMLVGVRKPLAPGQLKPKACRTLSAAGEQLGQNWAQAQVPFNICLCFWYLFMLLPNKTLAQEKAVAETTVACNRKERLHKLQGDLEFLNYEREWEREKREKKKKKGMIWLAIQLVFFFFLNKELHSFSFKKMEEN